MNKELDDLVSQADLQLQDLETEHLAKEAAHHVDEEVSHEAAIQYNHAALEKDPHVARSLARIAFGLLITLLIATGMYWSFGAPRATGSYHLVTGVVQSSSIIASPRLYYGSMAASKVKLPDGRTITIRLGSVRLLPSGTPMTLRVYDTGAVRTDRSL